MKMLVGRSLVLPLVTKDEKYMQRAIQLAEKGLGNVSPNPLVGCVLVKDEKIIGEGFHQVFGEGHAEVNAINSVSDQGLVAGSTCYVTLEPCAHHGKTPPCADLLIEKGIGRVVIGCKDPNDPVDGKGIKKLTGAGIEVKTGVLEKECRWMNRRFLTSIEKNRPYVILKWAQTADGFLARENGDSKWISNESSRRLVHKWRGEEDAILVGLNTARNDDPALTVRDWNGKHPTRIVLDSNIELSSDLKLFDGEVKTLVFNRRENRDDEKIEFVKYDGRLTSVLDALHERGIQSLIVEGGAKVLSSFIGEGMWDEARVFTSKEEFGSGIGSPSIGGLLLADQIETGDRLEIFQHVH